MEVNKLDIEGLTMKSIDVDTYNNIIIFETECGMKLEMYHHQDCCEHVTIEDINGDIDDLIGTPLIVAEERVNENSGYSCSETWTFYTFRTIKGTVDIRWHGYSNGYYSERVSFI